MVARPGKERLFWLLSMLILAQVLSGCTSADNELDQEGQDGSDNENPHSEDSVVWTEHIGDSGNSPNYLCVWPAPGDKACVIATFGYEMPEFSFENATILGLKATIEWEEGDYPALFGREVTVSCNDEEGGSCEEFPEPLVFEKDEPPLDIEIPDLDLPPKTLLVFYIAIHDSTPHPFQVEFDVSRAYSLKGTLELRS